MKTIRVIHQWKKKKKKARTFDQLKKNLCNLAIKTIQLPVCNSNKVKVIHMRTFPVHIVSEAPGSAYRSPDNSHIGDSHRFLLSLSRPLVAS